MWVQRVLCLKTNSKCASQWSPHYPNSYLSLTTSHSNMEHLFPGIHRGQLFCISETALFSTYVINAELFSHVGQYQNRFYSSSTDFIMLVVVDGWVTMKEKNSTLWLLSEPNIWEIVHEARHCQLLISYRWFIMFISGSSLCTVMHGTCHLLTTDSTKQ